MDPTTSEVTAFPLHQSADVMSFGDGSLWVLDTAGGLLTRVDPGTGRSHPSFPVSGNLQAMAVGGGSVWVVDTAGNQIWQVPGDLSSPATAVPVGQIAASPGSIAYDDWAIVVGFRDGTVAKINPDDPTSPAVIWTQKVGKNASSSAIGDGHRVGGRRSELASP